MQLETLDNLAVADVLQNTFATHTRTHAEHLAKDYIIKNPKEVGEFVSENLYLLDLLEEVPSRIYNYFGDNQKLALRVSHEPEFPNSSELWVDILTKLPATEATTLLDKFDEEWWLDNLERTNYKLNITLEFI
ncbi:MAG: hypothetical protein MUC29_13990 [Pyrinomonadaceae bacterium]|jgi:hypothetical protein|nr:hypothetical protein [Pyrinomonadaceae bacterium]